MKRTVFVFYPKGCTCGWPHFIEISTVVEVPQNIREIEKDSEEKINMLIYDEMAYLSPAQLKLLEEIELLKLPDPNMDGKRIR